MITFSWLLLIGLVGGVLAVIDGAARTRGRGTPILAIIEIVVGALWVLSLFFPSIPFGAVTLAIVTLIVLVVQLVLPGKRRGGAMTIIALILTAVWIVLALHWVIIPGVN
ncbi:hypothetical protein G3T36_08850 [Diaminobutyricibacter tongyongensis]|uniref:Uncharacterized protein n=1 Tax=Leifsonia tongyongensis TaxID=1268043 RepID=A0A6L9XX26_9MICO|nr:hypothetical protein [Diaminobutyricibacter tongyongensis]NEN05982.1 hypothetical protein [Diaminobutyricibacter tongyongensis]